jgi:E3 ubiquitin-protein ligase RNF38/44
MVIITVVGILAAFALLASYYAFVTKCQPLRALWSSRDPPWHRRARGQLPWEPSVIRAAAVAGNEHRGLGLPLIRMLPVVKFTAEAADHAVAGGRISVSECAVCLSEFEERERVRLLPNCSHAFHIDCIDTWLQGSARCPFCRSDVTLPAALPRTTTAHSHRRDSELARDDDSIVIEVRGEQETWFGGHEASTPAGRSRHRHRQKRKAESVGDEAIDTRKKDEAFAVQPLRRSLSLDSSCDKHLYLSVQEYLATQRQVSVV